MPYTPDWDRETGRQYGPSLEDRRVELSHYAKRLRTGTAFNDRMRDLFFDESRAERQERHDRNIRLAKQIEQQMADDPNYDGYGEIGYTVVNTDPPQPKGKYIRLDGKPQINQQKPKGFGVAVINKIRSTRENKGYFKANEWPYADLEVMSREMTRLSPAGARATGGYPRRDDGEYIDFYFDSNPGFDAQVLANQIKSPVAIIDDYTVRVYYIREGEIVDE